MPPAPPPLLPAFLTRWQSAGGAERANYQLFLTELCDLLQLPHPDPATPDDSQNNYVFDRAITVTNPDGSTSPNFIDLYKRNHFVLETKQGIERNPALPPAPRNADVPHVPPASPSSPGIISQGSSKPRKLKKGHGTRNSPLWNDALLRAKSQAESYVRSIPDDNPPFLLVVDVGYQIETYADFSGLGKTYTPFPDNLSHRFKLTDLADPTRGPELLDRLQKIWTDPQSLNPAKRSAKVTRKIAAALAELSKSLEKSGHHPEHVAHFLMRVLFTLFAEDVHLIPNNAFTNLLESLKDTPEKFAPMAQAVWQNMDKGGFSPVLREDLLRFNGGLFADTQALKLTGNQLELLIDAAHQDWSDVEPAIFGTLLERALDPTERHKLGAHYTPRAYVERLVLPTVIEPLREEWAAAKNAAVAQANKGTRAGLKAAIKSVADFLKHLCSVTILDPACGTANFLYVTLEHLKRLEGEVHDFLHQLAPNAQLPLEFTGLTVDPHQLRGIEINPRAAAIADLVLWIGYLQWHFRTHGKTMPQEPVLKKFDNIECRDAVLAYDKKELARDEHGKPLTRWDGISYKKHPITGDDMPDELKRTPIYQFIKPSKAIWPKADYILGNPPYLGTRVIKSGLGDEYVETLRAVYPELPETADFVMYWWHKAATAVRLNGAQRFGFITTNSITQDYSRPVMELHLSSPDGIAIKFAIADHPWADADSLAASVDVAMTMAVAKKSSKQTPATLGLIVGNDADPEKRPLELVLVESIGADLRLGNRKKPVPLKANESMCFQGVVPAGDGFKLTPDEAKKLKNPSTVMVIKPYIIGKDLVQTREPKFIIDLFSHDEKTVREKWPHIYQHLLDRVFPERKQNKRASYREKWWIFAEPRPAMRRALKGLRRFIVTPYTARHRPFVFVDEGTIPDAMAYSIASEDAYLLGILSSVCHTKWAMAEGGTLEDRPRYNSNVTFFPFPFPDCTEPQKSRIRKIAEELDAHRKRQQQKFPDLTLTDMYNILEKLRAAESPPPPRGGYIVPSNPNAPAASSNSPSKPRDHIPAATPSPITNYQSPITNHAIHSAAFSPKEKQIHDRGLISILKQLHEELDTAVFQAYNWPTTLTNDQLLQNLVTLNHQRAEEEKRGLIKYLRPEFQAGAKEFLRVETIPRLAKATLDFPYFSLEAVRVDLKRHNISVETATLPRYLHDLTKEKIIFDAGRGWYSTIATPFTLNHAPLRELVELLEKRFPFLDFSVWSTAQIARYGHHLLSRFVAFVYAPKDSMESVADAVRDSGHTVYLNPSREEAGKNFRIDDKTVVVRPSITQSPTIGKYAAIEKILVDLFKETSLLNLMDDHEFKRLMNNILMNERVEIGTLSRYSNDRRDLTLEELFGRKIN